MNYEEALNKVEYFMNKSGIREFCSETCQGWCCGSCHLSENACHKNEGRRISCSIFLCMELRDLLFNPAEMNEYLEMEKMINHELHKPLPGSIYFTPHTKEVRDKFLIEDQFLNILDKIDLMGIKNKLRSLKNIHIKLSRFLIQKLNNQGEHGNNNRK